MTDWYDTNTTSPDGLTDEEYRDWVADNVSHDVAEDYWYGEGAR
ncbi:hypothetical protein [Streptomyces sp. NPDC006267]